MYISVFLQARINFTYIYDQLLAFSSCGSFWTRNFTWYLKIPTSCCSPIHPPQFESIHKMCFHTTCLKEDIKQHLTPSSGRHSVILLKFAINIGNIVKDQPPVCGPNQPHSTYRAPHGHRRHPVGRKSTVKSQILNRCCRWQYVAETVFLNFYELEFSLSSYLV